ncbi:MAG TPA: CARDB domain-containing protein, partial [Dehalococcoidales bacterium]|nr:CARDB domain-containing protein [Dehalococcoidales bacterium]
QAISSQDVSLDGGVSQTVQFTTTGDAVGSYTVDVNGLTGTFAVQKAPVPATFSTSAVSINPATIDTNETATVTATVTNTGELAGSTTVVLKLNGNVLTTKDLSLAGGASQGVTFNVSKDVAGTYTINVNGQSSTLIVKSKTPFILANWWILVIIVVVVAAIVFIFLSIFKKGSSKGQGTI